MANEINFGWITGKTLKFNIYKKDGTARETDGTMTETPVSSGQYLGTPRAISAGDNVVVKEGSVVTGYGEYQPEVRTVNFEKDN